LTIEETPEDAAIRADGVLHARVQCTDFSAATSGILINPYEDDVALPDHTILVGHLGCPAWRVFSSRRQEIVGCDLDCSEHRTIQFEVSVALSNPDGSTLVELWKLDGWILGNYRLSLDAIFI
jgi:hypothetical protein